MKRRDFFSWLGLGWLGSAIASFYSQVTKANAASAGGFVTVGTVATLNKQGFITAQIGNKPAIVVRDPKNKNLLRAFNSTCTHANCTVSWERNNEFLCPCHASRFAADGKVKRGPAKKPLQSYQVRVQGNNVLVKAS